MAAADDYVQACTSVGRILHLGGQASY
jgi:hypothetical protein